MNLTTVLLCAVTAALSCMSVPSIYNLIKEIRFSLPFSLEMVMHAIWSSAERSRRIALEMFGAVFMALAFLGGQLWLASVAGTAGYIVWAASLLVCLRVFRPAPEMLTRSAFNITRFAAKYGLTENKNFRRLYEKEMKPEQNG